MAQNVTLMRNETRFKRKLLQLFIKGRCDIVINVKTKFFNYLKKEVTEMSKKNSFCCIVYCEAHKGCLKTEIYVLLHRPKKKIVYRKFTSCDAELKTYIKLRYKPGLYTGVGEACGL